MANDFTEITNSWVDFRYQGLPIIGSCSWHLGYAVKTCNHSMASLTAFQYGTWLRSAPQPRVRLGKEERELDPPTKTLVRSSMEVCIADKSSEKSDPTPSVAIPTENSA